MAFPPFSIRLLRGARPAACSWIELHPKTRQDKEPVGDDGIVLVLRFALKIKIDGTNML
jgi:hypothetical protein